MGVDTCAAAWINECNMSKDPRYDMRPRGEEWLESLPSEELLASNTVSVAIEGDANELCNTDLIGRRFRFNAWMGVEVAGARIS